MQKLICQIRKTQLQVSPEELVRQKVIAYLLQSGIPVGMFEVELGLRIWNKQSQERADILIRHPDVDLTQGEFWAIVECKAPGENLGLALDQIKRYSQSIRFQWAIVSDGQSFLVYSPQDHWSLQTQLPKW